MIKTAISNHKTNQYAFINETKDHKFGVTIIAPKDPREDIYLILPTMEHALSVAERMIK